MLEKQRCQFSPIDQVLKISLHQANMYYTFYSMTSELKFWHDGGKTMPIRTASFA